MKVNKMADTIKNMDFILADVLNVDQLEPDDYIMIDGDIVQVLNIASLKDGYVISFVNDFGEEDLIEVDDYAKFDWYVVEE